MPPTALRPPPREVVVAGEACVATGGDRVGGTVENDRLEPPLDVCEDDPYP